MPTHTHIRARCRRVLACAVAALAVLVVPQSAGAVTISGTVMKDERGTTWQGCAPLTQNVKLKLVGTATPVATTSCDPLTGAFNFTGVTIPAAGQVVAVWLADPSARGVLYTKAASTVANITGLTPTQDRVWIRSETPGDTFLLGTIRSWSSDEDADVPVVDSASGVTLGAGRELHVDDGITLNQNGYDVDAGAVHVSAGSTYQASSFMTTNLRAAGTDTNCTFGPGVAAPLCIEATGAFTQTATAVQYIVPSGEYTITPVTSRYLEIDGGAASLGIIGTAPGQTLTVQYDMQVRSSVTSAPWGTDIVSPRIGLEMDPGESWSGNSTFDIDVSRALVGEGTIELPQATVNLRGVTAKVDFGPMVHSATGNEDTEGTWTFRQVIMSNGGYARHVYGTAGAGPTYNSGAGDDRIVAVGTSFGAEYALYALPTGAGGSSWGVRKFNPDGSTNTAWDNSDSTPLDDLVIIDSAGADTPSSIVVLQDYVLVGGTYNGDFRVEALGHGSGVPQNAFDTDGVFTWNGGGSEQLAAMTYARSSLGNERIILAGSSLTSNTWEVLSMSVTGGAYTQLSWNGGSQGRVAGVCADAGQGGQVVVVGSVGAAGSRDWGVRRLTSGLTGWGTFGGAASYTWDAGGTEDTAVGCAIVDDRIHVAGTTGTGASDDWRVRGFTGTGAVDTSYATAGVLSINGAGDDDLHAVAADRQDFNTNMLTDAQGPGNIVIAGSNGTNGVVRRVDHDGQLDPTWGTSGTITIAGSESARALAWTDDAEVAAYSRIGRLFVGVREAANGGQSHVREYDAFGDLQADTLAGTIRVTGMGGLAGGSVHTGDLFQVGLSADSGNVLFDAESADTSIMADGSVTVANRGRMSASSSSELVVRNDALVLGPFWGNTGIVTMRGGEYRAYLRVAAANVQFHHLRVIADTKMLVFDDTNTIRVKGTFTVQGRSCTSPVHLRSETPGNQWDLDFTGGGTTSIRYAAIADWRLLNGIGGSMDSYDEGNNTGTILWSSPCAASYLNSPHGLQIGGVYHPQNVSTTSFGMSWFNRTGTSVDRADVEVYSSPTTDQTALWRLDGNGTDSSGNARNLSPVSGVSYVTGRFGQAASFTAASGGINGGDWDQPDDFTLDGWVKTDLSTATAWPNLIYKGDGTATVVNYRVGFDNAGDRLIAEVSGNAGALELEVGTPAGPVIDDEWHYVAATFRDGVLRLYVDGVLKASGTMPYLNADQTNDVVDLGWRLGGELDDWRVSSVAYGPDAIRGFYRTGRPHAEEVWDFDSSDTNGTVLTGAPFANNTRPGVTYAGPALDADGARYWSRARWRTSAAGAPANTWSLWSDFDWFETGQSTSVSLPSGSSLTLGSGATLPGVDAVGTTSFEVTTDNANGYTAYVTGPSDTWGMSDGLSGATHEIPGRGSPTSLQPWAAGTSGYFGLSVLSATGGKDTTRWGTGTTTSDLNTLNWGAPWRSQQLRLHTRSTQNVAPQTIVTAVRVNAAANQDPGVYTTTLTFTAVPNV